MVTSASRMLFLTSAVIAKLTVYSTKAINSTLNTSLSCGVQSPWVLCCRNHSIHSCVNCMTYVQPSYLQNNDVSDTAQPIKLSFYWTAITFKMSHMQLISGGKSCQQVFVIFALLAYLQINKKNNIFIMKAVNVACTGISHTINRNQKCSVVCNHTYFWSLKIFHPKGFLSSGLGRVQDEWNVATQIIPQNFAAKCFLISQSAEYLPSVEWSEWKVEKKG